MVRLALALIFPGAYFLVVKKYFKALLCVPLQLSVFGWFVASLFAVFDFFASNRKDVTKNKVGDMSEVGKVGSEDGQKKNSIGDKSTQPSKGVDKEVDSNLETQCDELLDVGCSHKFPRAGADVDVSARSVAVAESQEAECQMVDEKMNGFDVKKIPLRKYINRKGKWLNGHDDICVPHVEGTRWDVKKQIKKEAGAVGGYAYIGKDNAEDCSRSNISPLLMVDFSIFGSADTGLYLTETHIFVKSTFDGRYYCSIEDVNNINIDSGSKEIVLNGRRFGYSIDSLTSRLEFVVQCVKEFKSQALLP